MPRPTHRQIALIALAAAIALGVLGRLMPHPHNVTPIAALALFSGFAFARPATAVAVPLVSLLISDALIGFYDMRLMLFVFAGFLAPLLFRPLLRTRPQALVIAGCTVAGSLLFFLISNFGVWLIYDTYPKSLAGLGACYTAALPFLRNTLAGDLFWSAVFFGLYSLAMHGLGSARSGRLIAQPLR